MKPKPKGRKLRGKRGSNVRKPSGVTHSTVKMPTYSRILECAKMPRSDLKPNSARRPSFVKRLTIAMRPKFGKRPNYVKKHSCVKRCSSVRKPNCARRLNSVRRLSSAMRPKCDKRPNYVMRPSSAKRCNCVRMATSHSESRRASGMRQGSCAGNWSSCRPHCAWSGSSGNARPSTSTRSDIPGRTRRNGF